MPAFTELPQWISGKKVEDFLDVYFKTQGFKIRKTCLYEERILCLGDRAFYKDRHRWFVEYKSGEQTDFTDNVYLETISNDSLKHYKDGWVLTCRAHFVLYSALFEKKILLFLPGALRAVLPQLREIFPIYKTSHNQNDGYDAHGLVVPTKYAKERLARKIINLPDDLFP